MTLLLAPEHPFSGGRRSAPGLALRWMLALAGLLGLLDAIESAPLARSDGHAPIAACAPMCESGHSPQIFGHLERRNMQRSMGLRPLRCLPVAILQAGFRLTFILLNGIFGNPPASRMSHLDVQWHRAPSRR